MLHVEPSPLDSASMMGLFANAQVICSPGRVGTVFRACFPEHPGFKEIIMAKHGSLHSRGHAQSIIRDLCRKQSPILIISYDHMHMIGGVKTRAKINQLSTADLLPSVKIFLRNRNFAKP